MINFLKSTRTLGVRLAPVLLVLAAVVLAAPSSALAANDCTAETAAEFASKIAHGHAFVKHHGEFVEGLEIDGLAFPDPTIANADEFATFLEGILTGEDVLERALINSRRGYWDARTGTVIITNMSPADCGTAFRPTSGKTYYDNLT